MWKSNMQIWIGSRSPHRYRGLDLHRRRMEGSHPAEANTKAGLMSKKEFEDTYPGLPALPGHALPGQQVGGYFSSVGCSGQQAH